MGHAAVTSVDPDGTDPSGLSVRAVDVLIHAYGQVAGREGVGHVLIRVGQRVEGGQIALDFHAVIGRLDQANGDELAHVPAQFRFHDEVGDHQRGAVYHEVGDVAAESVGAAGRDSQLVNGGLRHGSQATPPGGQPEGGDPPQPYAEWAAYWPGASGPFAKPMNEIPKVVVSDSLASADCGETTIAAGDLAEAITRLRQERSDGYLLAQVQQSLPVSSGQPLTFSSAS